jgi:hypothetical protein
LSTPAALAPASIASYTPTPCAIPFAILANGNVLPNALATLADVFIANNFAPAFGTGAKILTIPFANSSVIPNS